MDRLMDAVRRPWRWLAGGPRPTPIRRRPRRALLGLESLEGRETPATHTLFDTTAAPAAALTATTDTSAVALGVKFTVDAPGSVSAVRFYRGPGAETPSGYSASLWRADGTLLRTGNIIENQGPTPGWQTVTFSAIDVTPGETYVASYYASSGRYSYTHNGLASGIDAGPLNAPSSASAGGNGVYVYGGGTAFPNASYLASNYWVTPVLTTAEVPTVTLVNPNAGPTAGGTPVTVFGSNFLGGGTPVVYFGNTPVTPTGVTATRLFATAPAGAAGTVDVRVQNSAGTSANTSADDFTYVAPPGSVTGVTVTTGVGQNVVSWSPTPGLVDGFYYVSRDPGYGGGSSAPLGVIRAVEGTVTSVTDVFVTPGQAYTYYVQAVNKLGQLGPLSAGVAVTAAAAPVITSISPANGPIAGGTAVTITGQGFDLATNYKVFFGSREATGFSYVSPTQIVATSPAGPAGTFNVQVVLPNGYQSPATTATRFTYLNQGPPGAPTNLTPTAGVDQVTLNWDYVPGSTGYSVYRGTTSLGEVQVATVSGELNTTYVDSVPGGVTYYYYVKAFNAAGEGGRSNEVAVTPPASAPSAPAIQAAAVPGDLRVNVSWTAVPSAVGYKFYRGLSPDALTLRAEGGTAFTGFVDVNGNAGLIPLQSYYYRVVAVFAGGVEGPPSDVASATVEFRSGYTYGVWNNVETPFDLAPDNPVEQDFAPVEVGTKFEIDVAGELLAVRFYRGVATPGGYTVNLWSADGTLLATASTTSDTGGAGWRSIAFASPVLLQAGQTYVASYYASEGGYAADEGDFTGNSFDIGPVHLPSSEESGGNGVYRYGTGGGFPEFTYNDTNYWVDVSFRTL